MQKSDWLTQLKSFIGVVEHQSFSKTADKHYQSPAAISRQVKWLEERLGVKLLQRTTRSLQLTEEGNIFYQHAKKILADLTDAIELIRKQQHRLQGNIKITMPHSFGETKLVELLQKAIKKHPLIELTLDFTNQIRHLHHEAIDIALRTHSEPSNDYHSIKLASIPLGIYASPIYLKKHGLPKNPAQLDKHCCLQHEHIGQDKWLFKNEQVISVSGNVRINATLPLIRFARQGLGLIQMLACYMQEDLEKKRMVPILEKYWPPPIDLYLIYRANPTTPLRIKVIVEELMQSRFIDYLVLV